jgi:hypothetical protein
MLPLAQTDSYQGDLIFDHDEPERNGRAPVESFAVSAQILGPIGIIHQREQFGRQDFSKGQSRKFIRCREPGQIIAAPEPAWRAVIRPDVNDCHVRPGGNAPQPRPGKGRGQEKQNGQYDP